jgi:hypothetical protein
MSCPKRSLVEVPTTPNIASFLRLDDNTCSFGLVCKFEATQLKTNNATPFQSLNLITANNVRWEMCLLNTAYLGVPLLLREVSSN